MNINYSSLIIYSSTDLRLSTVQKLAKETTLREISQPAIYGLLNTLNLVLRILDKKALNTYENVKK